ncbi:MAG TPA: universal stress protein [Pseudonocardia sp.]
MRGQPPGRKIVVGVDGSEQALLAVRWAAAEAECRDVPLRLVSALASVPEDSIVQSRLRERYRENLLERTEVRLRAAVAVVQRENPTVEIDHQVMVGSPHAVLRCEARHAQFVVVGDGGLRQVEGLHTGSVTVALAAQAACPVVVVRGIEQAPSAVPSLPVVVGVDGSPTSAEAVAFAFEAAAARQVPLVAVHTWWNLLPESASALPYDWDAIQADARQLLAELLAVWAEKYSDVRVECVVTRGHPARSLLEEAAGARLVVVGSRGWSESAGSFLGSVSTLLLHHAPCPVAVVPSPEGDDQDAP